MDHVDAYILGASALIEALPAVAPSDPEERLKLIGPLVEQVKESLGGNEVHEHEEWLSICDGMSHVGERWVETGDISEGAPIE